MFYFMYAPFRLHFLVRGFRISNFGEDEIIFLHSGTHKHFGCVPCVFLGCQSYFFSCSQAEIQRLKDSAADASGDSSEVNSQVSTAFTEELRAARDNSEKIAECVALHCIRNINPEFLNTFYMLT